jgi:hypothetical protein
MLFNPFRGCESFVLPVLIILNSSGVLYIKLKKFKEVRRTSILLTKMEFLCHNPEGVE